MKCPSCNKFAGLNFEEPEIQDEATLNDGVVSASVRIYRTSECCGDEMKEATLDMEMEIPQEIIDAHTGNGHELEVKADDPQQVEEGGGRYAKSFFGASIDFTIRCFCQKEQDEPLFTGTLEDKIAASAMDEMC